MNEYEFEDIFSCKFGDHKKTEAYIPGRSARIICRTGNISEENLKLWTGSRWPGMGTPMADTFTDEDGNEYNLTSGLYLSDDGVDPLAGKPTGDGGFTADRENAALQPNSIYFWDVEVTKEGHPSWIPKMKVNYSGTDTDSDHIVLPGGGDGLDMVIAGVPGKWFETK